MSAETLLPPSLLPHARTPAQRIAIAACIMLCVEVVFAVYAYLTSHALSGSKLSPLVFAWLRDVVATALLLSAAFASERRRPAAERRFWPAEEHWLRLLLCGTLGVWGSQGMSALALAHLDPTTFSLLQPLMPVVTVAVGTLSGVEPPFSARAWTTWAKVSGLCIAVAGAMIVVVYSSSGRAPGSGASFLGLLFAGLQLCTGSSYPVAQKALFAHYSPIVVAAWCYGAGLVVLSLSVATGAASPSDWTLDLRAAGAIAFAGVFASAFAYGAMAWANKLVGPVLLIVFFPLLPLFTAILVWILDGIVISLGAALGGVCITAGLACVVAAKFRETNDAAAAEGALLIAPESSDASAEGSDTDK
jgi:drug/metabolite transporter (DMT)-like permease